MTLGIPGQAQTHVLDRKDRFLAMGIPSYYAPELDHPYACVWRQGAGRRGHGQQPSREPVPQHGTMRWEHHLGPRRSWMGSTTRLLPPHLPALVAISSLPPPEGARPPAAHTFPSCQCHPQLTSPALERLQLPWLVPTLFAVMTLKHPRVVLVQEERRCRDERHGCGEGRPDEERLSEPGLVPLEDRCLEGVGQEKGSENTKWRRRIY